MTLREEPTPDRRLSDRPVRVGFLSFYGPIFGEGADFNGATLRTRLTVEAFAAAGYECVLLSCGSQRRTLEGPGWREVTVPVPHPILLERLRRKLGSRMGKANLGREILHVLGIEAPEFVDRVVEECSGARVLLVDLPWLGPAARSAAHRLGASVIMTSHNVESDRFVAIHATSPSGKLRAGLYRLLRSRVARFEIDELNLADWAVACTAADRERLIDLGASPSLALVSNPVRSSDVERGPVKRSALFVGSGLQPNVEAARWILEVLAPAAPSLTFTIVGRCATTLSGPVPANVVLAGTVSDADLVAAYTTHGCAIVPLFSGSGSSIKTVESLAQGLPVVSTPIGARGIEDVAEYVAIAQSAADFERGIVRAIESDTPALDAERRAAARQFSGALALAPYLHWVSTRVAHVDEGHP